MTPEERDTLVDMIAQAVIDRIEERERISRITNQIVARVLELQRQEAALRQDTAAGNDDTSGVRPDHADGER